MTRLAMISVLLIVGVATTGAAILTAQEPRSARPAAPAKAAAQEPKPDKPAAPAKKVELISVRVVDVKDRDVPNVEVAVIDQRFFSENRRYRTGADGRFRVPVNPNYFQIAFEAHPDDRTIGWARITNGNLWPAGTDKDPVTLMLLPMNHRVEGSVVDTRGKPIRGVRIRPYQIEHEKTNGFGSPLNLPSAVTDDMGRFTLDLPADTRVSLLRADHPRYVGPWFHCGAEDQSIAPMTLLDAGGIAGTVIDSTTGKPVEGVRVGAQTLERGLEVPLGGGGGEATSDAHGHFQVGGLAPGVYNLLFEASPRGRRFTARAVEGVRVRAGEDAQADLVMIEGRRLRGTAIYLYDNTPMVGIHVSCYSPPHLRSGPVEQGTYTDDQGRFEFFVPPGPAVVSIPAHTKTLTIPVDRAPEPVRLENNPNPTTLPSPKFVKVAQCPVRVRMKVNEGKDAEQGKVRTLSGRIFDPEGSHIAGVRVSYSEPGKFQSSATDRLGLFRLRGLPQGELRLHLDKEGYGAGWSIIPPDAWEIEVTLPSQPDALE